MKSIKMLASLLALSAIFMSDLFAACTLITQVDIPLTITLPGDYCLDEDVTFAGPGNAITVTVSNVNINLQGYQISQTGVTNNTNGIYVNPNLTNVNIFNGSVNGFSFTGIWYDAGNTSFDIYDLLIENCGTPLVNNYPQGQGILLGPIVPTSDPTQIGTYVSNVTLTNSSLLNNGVGLVIFGNENIYVDNVRCNHSLADGAFIQGIYFDQNIDNQDQELVYLKDLRVYNSTFNQNGVSGLASQGLSLVSALNPHVKGCQFNDNSLSGLPVSAGLVCSGIVNALIEHNQFNNNSWVPPFPGAVAFLFAGFHTSANVFPVGLQAAANITLRNNEAKGNMAPGFVNGMLIAYQNNILIENNIASQNICFGQQPDPSTGTISTFPCSAGIFIDGSSGIFGPTDNLGTISNCVCRNNVTCNNIAEQGLGAGIYLNGGAFIATDIIEQNFVLHHNIAQGNNGLADSPAISGNLFFAGNFPAVQGIGAGIIIDRGIILHPENALFGSEHSPAAEYLNLSIIGNTLQGNVFGTAGADAWSSLVPYGQNEVVSFEGTVYQSLQDNNLNNQPNTSPTFWAALLPATGGQYSGGLVLIGVDSGVVADNDATGNTNGFVLTGGTTWDGQEIASTANILVQNNEAVSNTLYGFIDTQFGVKKRAGHNLNAFVENSAFNNGCNYRIKKDANVDNISISRKKSRNRSH